MGYDEPEILLYSLSRNCFIGAEPGHCFRDLTLHRSGAYTRKARTGAPALRQRARLIEDHELNTARLITRLPSELPALLVDRHGGGLFLRPHEKGPVVAELPWAFPAFAKRVNAQVEIAHEEASDFEFAMALCRPDTTPDWKKNIEGQTLAFSGWKRVTDRFSLNELSVRLDERIKSHLALHLAIRLPAGSKSSPANAFWRKLVLVWDE